MTAATDYWSTQAEWSDDPQYSLKDLTRMLVGWTEGESFQITSATYDGTGILATAVVQWPDGNSGVLTTTSANVTFSTIDAYTITHSAGKTVTQALVTRNGDGNITVKPALVVT